MNYQSDLMSKSNLFSLDILEVLIRLGFIPFEFDIVNRIIILNKETALKYNLPHRLQANPSALIQAGILHDESKDMCTRLIEALYNKQDMACQVLRLLRPEGCISWCECSLICYSKDCTHALLCIKNKSEEYEKNVILLREQQYHYALLRDAIHVYKVNITKNLAKNNNNKSENTNYTEIFKKILEKHVHPRHVLRVLNVLSRNNVLEAFNQGRSDLNVEYRSCEHNEDYLWVKCTLNLLKDPQTKDVVGIMSIRDIEQVKRVEQEMKNRAERDSLCKLYNHGATKHHISDFLSSHEGSRNFHSFLLFDIDNFKNINDTHGHLQGDLLLTKMSERIQSIVRSTDILGRVGGDEFVLFVKNITSVETAVKKAFEINDTIKTMHIPDTNGLKVSVSIGISLCPEHGLSFEELYRHADIALYQAKNTGKNTYHIYQPGDVRM